MPSHPWFIQPAALDSAVGAGTIGGNMLTDTVPSDLNSVHTDFAPASLVTLFGTTPPYSCYLQTVVFSKRCSK